MHYGLLHSEMQSQQVEGKFSSDLYSNCSINNKNRIKNRENEQLATCSPRQRRLLSFLFEPKLPASSSSSPIGRAKRTREMESRLLPDEPMLEELSRSSIPSCGEEDRDKFLGAARVAEVADDVAVLPFCWQSERKESPRCRPLRIDFGFPRTALSDSGAPSQQERMDVCGETDAWLSSGMLRIRTISPLEDGEKSSASLSSGGTGRIMESVTALPPLTLFARPASSSKVSNTAKMGNEFDSNMLEAGQLDGDRRARSSSAVEKWLCT